MMKVILSVLLILAVILGSKMLKNNNQMHQSAQIAKMTESPPQEQVILTRTVDSHGADIAVGHIGSPIDGLVIHIPPGAMEQADRITLGYSMRSVPVITGRASGVVIILRAETLLEFRELVTVEVHYNASPPPTLAIPYRLDTKGRLDDVMNIKSFDEANNIVVFYILAPGDFTWIYP